MKQYCIIEKMYKVKEKSMQASKRRRARTAIGSSPVRGAPARDNERREAPEEAGRCESARCGGGIEGYLRRGTARVYLRKRRSKNENKRRRAQSVPKYVHMHRPIRMVARHDWGPREQYPQNGKSQMGRRWTTFCGRWAR
jgi:hypothetical protein